ncbi:MAG: hypothetical protein AAF432_07680 [Planctomycetota bacterium]
MHTDTPIMMLATLRYDELPYGPMVESSVGAMSPPWLIIGAVVFGVSLATCLAWIVLQWGGARSRADAQLSRLLARNCTLTHRERRALHQMARLADIPHASALLVSDGCFHHAARQYVRRRGDRRIVASIRHKVFT